MSKTIISANYLPAQANPIHPQNQHLLNLQQRGIADRATTVFFNTLLANDAVFASALQTTNIPHGAELTLKNKAAEFQVIGRHLQPASDGGDVVVGPQFLDHHINSNHKNPQVYQACQSVASVMEILEQDAPLFDSEPSSQESTPRKETYSSPIPSPREERKHPTPMSTPPATPRHSLDSSDDDYAIDEEDNEGEEEVYTITRPNEAYTITRPELYLIKPSQTPEFYQITPYGDVAIPNAIDLCDSDLESDSDNANEDDEDLEDISLTVEQLIQRKSQLSREADPDDNDYAIDDILEEADWLLEDDIIPQIEECREKLQDIDRALKATNRDNNERDLLLTEQKRLEAQLSSLTQFEDIVTEHFVQINL